MAAIAIDGKSVYRDDWAEWMQETFIVSDQDYETILAQSPPISRQVLYVLPKDSHIMLQSPHEKMDGIRLMLFFDSFFKAIQSSDIKEEDKEDDVLNRISPPLIKIIQVPEPTAKDKQEAVAFIQTFAQPAVQLSARNLGQMPKENASFLLTLSKVDLDAIIKACKATRVDRNDYRTRQQT
jgi:hypothetical protein